MTFSSTAFSKMTFLTITLVRLTFNRMTPDESSCELGDSTECTITLYNVESHSGPMLFNQYNYLVTNTLAYLTMVAEHTNIRLR
jgi:hypothetical protein